MSEKTLTHMDLLTELAHEVYKAADKLNAAITKAVEAGLRVEIDVRDVTMIGRPRHTLVNPQVLKSLP